MNPSVQKGAKIVLKVGVETVKVATPIVAKGVATGIKEGGKLAFKVALGANSMGNERREKKEAKKIVVEIRVTNAAFLFECKRYARAK